jgi:hypothetical protein
MGLAVIKNSRIFEKLNILKEGRVLIVGMAVPDVDLGALFGIMVQRAVIKVFAMCKVFKIIKGVGHGGLDKLNAVLE